MLEFGLGQPRRKKRIPLARAERLANRLLEDVEPEVEFALTVGSIRRQVPQVADVEIVVLPIDLGQFLEYVGELGFTGGERIRRAIHSSGVLLEVYIAHDPKELGALVFHGTGDFVFNTAMRSKAKKRGLKLNQYGIWKGDRPVLQSENERDFFKFLGVRYHEPEERSLAARVKPRKARAKMGDSNWNEIWGEEE